MPFSAGIVNYLEDIDSAIEKKAKLPIITVKFSDGSIWKMPTRMEIFPRVRDEIREWLIEFAGK